MGKIVYKTKDLELEINGFVADDSVKILNAIGLNNKRIANDKEISKNIDDNVCKDSEYISQYIDGKILENKDSKDRFPNEENENIKLECPSCHQRLIFHIGIVEQKTILQTSIGGSYAVVEMNEVPLSDNFCIHSATADEIHDFIEFASSFKEHSTLTFNHLKSSAVIECPSCKKADSCDEFIKQALEAELEYQCPVCSGEVEMIVNKEETFVKKCTKCGLEI